jgi:hypothetical protein
VGLGNSRVRTVRSSNIVFHLDSAPSSALASRYSVFFCRYEAECKKLLTQFKTLRDSLAADFDIPSFLAKYGLNCPLACSRLIRDGVPATIKHGAARDGGAAAASERSVIFEVVRSLVLRVGIVVQLCILRLHEKHETLFQNEPLITFIH